MFDSYFKQKKIVDIDLVLFHKALKKFKFIEVENLNRITSYNVCYTKLLREVRPGGGAFLHSAGPLP